MRPLLVLVLVAGLTWCAATTMVMAHTGASWNVPDGAYTVDVGYDPETFTAGQYARFDFLLWKGPANTGEPEAFSQIWVRMVRGDGDTVLATGIWKQPTGPTTLLFEFAEPGAYVLETSYRDADGADIAVASFPVSVSVAPDSSSKARTYALLVLAALIGALGGALGMRTARLRA